MPLYSSKAKKISIFFVAFPIFGSSGNLLSASGTICDSWKMRIVVFDKVAAKVGIVLHLILCRQILATVYRYERFLCTAAALNSSRLLQFFCYERAQQKSNSPHRADFVEKLILDRGMIC